MTVAARVAVADGRVYPRRVHFAELTAPEQRVLGCLIEKRWTTPDQYPLSLNALRLACNQSTNRDPVTRYDEDTVSDAAQRLCTYGLARLASGHTSRATKYRHLAEEGLWLNREQLAVLAVLLLRGPQTPGELKARSERMAPVQSLAEVERVLAELDERGYARRLGRRPGQKEDRFAQLLGRHDGTGGAARSRRRGEPIAAGGFTRRRPAPTGAQPREPRPREHTHDNGDADARVAALEAEVADLKRPARPTCSVRPAQVPAARGRQKGARHRRSRRPASSPARPPTMCAASPVTWRRRPGSGHQRHDAGESDRHRPGGEDERDHRDDRPQPGGDAGRDRRLDRVAVAGAGDAELLRGERLEHRVGVA